MGMDKKLDLYAVDYVSGITYIGYANSAHLEGHLDIVPLAVAPTVELARATRGYSNAAMAVFNDARANRQLLKGDSNLSDEGRIAINKLETIEYSD
jgi:hypothetical protein